MKTNVKLLGAALAVSFMVGCTGQGLPTGTGGLGVGEPGFTGRVTKNGNPVSGATVWLKKYSGEEGTLVGGSAVPGSQVKTDSNGTYFIPAPAEAVSGGALFGIGYDVANTQFGGTAERVSAGNLTDEIQWFSSPAVNLKTKTGNTANVSFDIGWNIAGFSPQHGATVTPTDNKITFTLPPKTGATMYEVQVNKGNVAGSGTRVGDPIKSDNPSLVWNNPVPGEYTYQAKAHLPSGVAGVTGTSQAASPWLVFTVAGAQ